MSEHDSDARTDDDVLQQALRRWEHGQAASVPGFPAVSRRIAATPSPLDRSRWTVARSLRLAGALAWAQVRIVPWLVIPVALLMAAAAVPAAWFLGLHRDASAAVSGFSSLVLFGVTVTVTMALSTTTPDAVSLATPLGPQVVVLTRVATVLAMNAAAAFAASVVVVGWGLTDSFLAVLAGWLVPLAAIAGAVTFLAVWSTPWVGIVVGIVLMPMLAPQPDSAADFGLGVATGAVREALTPVGVATLGVILLTLAVVSARRAWTVRATTP